MELGSPPIGGDRDRGPELVAVIWVFTALALAVFGLKIYTRFRIIHEAGLDDVFTFASVVLVVICASVITASVKKGMGRHAYYLSPEQRVQATKINFIANPFGIMAYSLPNISVAIFLNRILSPNRWRKSLLYGVTIAQSVIAGISCIILFVQCRPSKSLWDPAVPSTCLPSLVITGYSYFVGSYSAFTDIFLAIVPITAFWKLQMKLKTKIGLCLLMGMTAFAAICAIIKTTKLNELAVLNDFTFATVDLLIWAIVEADVIIIAACIPSLRPFVVSVRQSFRESNSEAFLHRKGYNSHPSNRLFALKPMSLGVNGSASEGTNDRSSGPRSERSLRAANDINQTTEIATKWEPV